MAPAVDPLGPLQEDRGGCPPNMGTLSRSIQTRRAPAPRSHWLNAASVTDPPPPPASQNSEHLFCCRVQYGGPCCLTLAQSTPTRSHILKKCSAYKRSQHRGWNNPDRQSAWPSQLGPLQQPTGPGDWRG